MAVRVGRCVEEDVRLGTTKEKRCWVEVDGWLFRKCCWYGVGVGEQKSSCEQKKAPSSVLALWRLSLLFPARQKTLSFSSTMERETRECILDILGVRRLGNLVSHCTESRSCHTAISTPWKFIWDNFLSVYQNVCIKWCGSRRINTVQAHDHFTSISYTYKYRIAERSAVVPVQRAHCLFFW